MSDEKRQTRLLPFRLRRARRAGPDGVEDFSADAELTALLREWEAPPQSGDARARLLADFRAGVAPAPLWRRALTSQIRVPLPVAACAALALLLTPLAFGARPWTKSTPTPEGATTLPARRITNRSPSPWSNTSSAGTRESEQPRMIAKGCWPAASSARRV